MNEEDVKNLSAKVVEDYNGWYTIEIAYKGKVIKTVHQ